jgi:hypothetical protein
MEEYCQLGKHMVTEDEIAIDDYGLVACHECYDNDPEAQKAMNRAVANDPVEQDHNQY